MRRKPLSVISLTVLFCLISCGGESDSTTAERPISSTPSSDHTSSSSSTEELTNSRFKDSFGEIFKDQVTGEKISKIPEGSQVKSGLLTYRTDKNYQVPYAYSDALFDYRSAVFSEPLEKMSLALAISDRSDQQDRNRPISTLYTALGFTEKVFTDEERNLIAGAHLAKREYSSGDKSGTLISINLPSDLSFTPSQEGNPEEIDYSRYLNAVENICKEADAFIQSEVDASKYSDVKLWITGHSIGGSLANLLGHELNEASLSSSSYATLKNISRDQIYCYTFGSAALAQNQTETVLLSHDNIFNTFLDTDFIPHIFFNKKEANARSGWDFARYGLDHVIDTSLKAEKDKAMKYYRDHGYQEGYAAKDIVSLYDLNMTAAMSENSSNIDIEKMICEVKPQETISIQGLYKNLMMYLTDPYGVCFTEDKMKTISTVMTEFYLIYNPLDETKKTSLKDSAKAWFSDQEKLSAAMESILPEIMATNEKPKNKSGSRDFPNTYKLFSDIVDSSSLSALEKIAFKTFLEKNVPYIVWTLNGLYQLFTGDCRVLIASLIGNANATLQANSAEALISWIYR